jgi:hypothetical protein
MVGSKPSPKPISKADYHGRGKGRGRSKVVRRMASKQTLLAKPGKSDEFDLDMGDLDAFGEGPIGRGMLKDFVVICSYFHHDTH